jgi:hypothetical protein
MGLVATRGNGLPAMDSTGTSIFMDHPTGTIAYDSSGGAYIYARRAATTVSFGSLCVMTPNSSGSTASTGSVNDLVAVLASSVTATLGPMGIAQADCSSATGSTGTFGWFQVYGNALALTTGAGIGTGVPLFTSLDNKGYVMNTTTGIRLIGVNVNSSVGSSGLIPVFLQYPHVLSTA